jgi:dipeptidyl aminopeptidase/acylaminoacyl peptidase
MLLHRSRFACSVLTLLVSASLAAGAGRAADTAAGAVPIEHFFDNPAFSGATLSPDARFLAARVTRPGKGAALAVVDLANNTVKVVAGLSDADIGKISWISNERLVFDAADPDIADGDRRLGPGLFAVNRDGSELRELIERSRRPSGRVLPANTVLLAQRGAQDSEYIYVTSTKLDRNRDFEYSNLLRLNTLTGRTSTVVRPGNVSSWLLDYKGEPRLATVRDQNVTSLLYADPSTGQWRKLSSFDTYLGGKGAVAPVAFAPDGTLYVTSNAGRDKAALFRYDLAGGKPEGAPTVELENYDFTSDLVTANGKLLGVQVLTDARSTIWLDAGLKALQQRVDALLPGTINLLSLAARAETPWVLVESFSDIQPRRWNLFNTETGKLNKVGEAHPRIVPSQMGQQEAVRYKARDGLTIPAYLTLPAGAQRKNLPLVVLVHGGPYLRGAEWGWRPDVQFLASRGYAVLQPEFRGSTGFGARHYVAGWKQWGLAMQNDIADGARWAIAEGIVDPQRICIAGGSYGGYAALMGLINDPSLFKCGIDAYGVTDIGLLTTGDWSKRSDTSDTYKQFGMPVLVGDIVKDAEQLTATSPLQQAARLKQPLLMAYGGADVRVPIYHGRKFYDAVRQTNPNVELVVYEEEGHGWVLPKNRIDYWSRVGKFLDAHIGKPAAK